MNADPVLQVIVERCTGAAASALGAAPTGAMGNNSYTGQDDEAKAIASLGRPQFSARLASSEPVNGSLRAIRTSKVTVELTTSFPYHETLISSAAARNALLARAATTAAAVEDALIHFGGLELTADGRATLIVSGVCSKVTASRMGRLAPKPGTGVTVEWTTLVELFVESMTPAGPLMSTEGFSDSDYWQGTTQFGDNPLGTKRFVLRVTGVDDAGYVMVQRNAWALLAYASGNGTLYPGAYANVSSFNGSLYVSQNNFRWTWPPEMVGGVVVLHFTCNGTTEELYAGGCLVSSSAPVDAAPTSQPAERLTIGRFPTASNFSSASFGVVQFEFTDDVLSASQIARDAALCMSTMTQRARFPQLSNRTVAFDARDANTSNWASQVNPSHVLAKTGTPRWRAV